MGGAPLDFRDWKLALDVRIASSHSEKLAIVYIGLVSKVFRNLGQKN